MSKNKYDLIAIVGPTASGKTQLAAHLAARLNGEIISADSRQVYRGMTIGTGKDLDDYVVDGQEIPYHLIDIVDAGYKFNVFEYQQHFIDAYNDIKSRNRLPILCGGSGLYVDSVLRGYKLLPVPENPELRRELESKTDEELAKILSSYKKLHNTTDLDTRKRTIRAIEIEEYYKRQPVDPNPFPEINSIVFGVKYQRATEMKRIRERLAQRLESGMIDEVKALLDSGLNADDLIYYGLEYKYITEYLLGKYSYDEMFEKLYIAIRQFAKRQMTWFRGMERKGFTINWIPGELSLEEKMSIIFDRINS
ncbi:tRNA (adenosine(37)-N6)-dimethylallyltransferase MiaA [Tenuifilum thalassicum]|uniref:tRNA dimethylallyltransferase n=1 Tax=Tenuifilum thalassicum TaxID=2590900 RepID=A0A7D3Y5H1_9BACT|nr:tRNA (adenosine(37)-N6)-dimethylallyltransferase MiaA [Tenuifilum thalassicum]QKG80629.1 tRNA (adenosine(37)-N6)-dimethylallyltransferase MiaA [Tenuifilum thalassicum]